MTETDEREAAMGILAKFENRLEQMVSGAFAKAFRSAVQPVEIAAALQREVDNSAQILSRNRRLVPEPVPRRAVPAGPRATRAVLLDAGPGAHRDAARARPRAVLRLHRPGLDRLRPAEDLSTGRFRVRSAALAKVTPVSDRSVTDTAVRRAHVILEVNGMRHPLDPPGIVIGRGTEADLRINDPGVSRRHAEIRVHPAGGRGGAEVSVVDLGSTNGMLVNGSKVQQATLDDGGEIKIGNTTMTVRLVADDTGRGEHTGRRESDPDEGRSDWGRPPSWDRPDDERPDGRGAAGV